jgi:type IV pilus assembly protein PilB
VGKFNIDDLMKDLGDENPDAPKEPSPEGATAPAGAPARSDGAEADDPNRPFIRQDPTEIPRPPDLTGGGLGSELAPSSAGDGANPVRLRPTDGLNEIIPTDAIVPFGKEDGHGSGYRPISAGDDLGQVLLDRGIIDSEQLETLRRMQKQSPGVSLCAVLVDAGVEEADVQAVIAEAGRLPFERIDAEEPDSIDHKFFNRLGQEFCENSLVMPLRREGKRLVVGTASPDDVFLLDDVKRRLGVVSIKHVLVPAGDIRAVLESLKGVDDEEEFAMDEILSDVDEDDVELVQQKQEDASEDDAEASPTVRLVNHIIQTAVKEGASDIHIEPEETRTKVRFRIDGILFEMMQFPRKKHAAITSRLKIMANLDIAERRLPQDGRIRVILNGRQLDLRMSTVPTPKGEKTVMRILDNRAIKVTLDQLGFGEDTLHIWKGQIAQPHGVMLVTGPTGSGKTTTLYASLQQLDRTKLNISTVEDPVEYNLDGITQIQTHQMIGMTFAKALKALLRQDPDIVMVGEIRDLETATTATQAAMTGHLVLSTLHTNDAPSSVTRLINMGIEPFLAAAAVNGVLAQRLVRRICSSCKQQVPVPEEMKDFLVMHGVQGDTLSKGKGCNKCRQTGYSGRQGLYELLVLDDHLRDAISGNPNVTEFRRMCKERGMVSLREDGFQKVIDGITTVEEILRVTEATI